ncbi:hypothetical protein DNH61_02975 [Paenibacillus sambharensis]|uniref:Uncharacterized protein n=1 Tax=Paenibacillus sambharensis TaxID=1803190 RepID=A0A2W1LF65_9BACL|nr:hypothetical protein [Paenibacillus sambharensis]PZD97329.1 hypothetical protein DNH61_02975 [Paenibacillus sambharensis]
MSSEQELREIKETLKSIDERLAVMENNEGDERPFWLNFLIAFGVVLTAILLIVGISVFIGKE